MRRVHPRLYLQRPSNLRGGGGGKHTHHARGKIIERVQNDTAPYFQQQWAALAEHSLVGNVRGIGMVAGLELATADGKPYGASVGAQCRDLSIANGLVMRSIGDAMIVAPPLVISKAQIDELITKVRQIAGRIDGETRPLIQSKSWDMFLRK